MKNIFILIAYTTVFSLTIHAQQKTLCFYGQIENSRHDTITLSNHYGQYIAVTNAKGEFRFVEELENPDFLNLNIKDYNLTLFLFAGDSLEMKSNINDFPNSITFKGKRAELNQDLVSLAPDVKAPQFSLKNVNGELVSLSDFKGKHVYIDVWNSGCRPCFKEFPKYLLYPIFYIFLPKIVFCSNCKLPSNLASCSFFFAYFGAVKLIIE